MSGQKDLVVHEVDERLRREQETAAARERRCAETAAALARADERQKQAEASLRSLQSERDRLRERQQHAARELEDVRIQHAALQRRMARMKEETLRAQTEARQVADQISQEERQVAHDIERLRDAERSLAADLQAITQTMAKLDGTDLVRAKQEMEQAAAELAAQAEDQMRIDIGIAARGADETTGIVVEQLIGAMIESNFKVVHVFNDQQQLEIRMQHLTGEVVSIAVDLTKKIAEERHAQPGPKLQLVLEREQRDVEACIADTMQIVERLRKRGVAVTLRLPKEEPEGHRLANERERSGGRENA